MRLARPIKLFDTERMSVDADYVVVLFSQVLKNGLYTVGRCISSMKTKNICAHGFMMIILFQFTN